MMSTYTHHLWTILEITPPSGEKLYKIFATWRGGYTTGDSWKLNSGNEKIVKDIARGYECYHVHGYSGSIYELHKDGYGLSAYSSGVLQQFLKEHCVRLLSEEESLEYLERMSNEHTT